MHSANEANTGTEAQSDAAPAASPAWEALLLVGGLGSRLRAVVEDRPKPMALVDGEPFVLRLLDQLAAAGCRRVILCTGYRGELVEQELGHEHAGMELVYSREDQPLGTGGAVRLALPLVRAGAVLLLNGDSYAELDLREFLAAAQRSAWRAALIAVSVVDTSRYGSVELGLAGRVVAFREKASPAGPGFINAGIYWFATETLAASLPAGPCSLEQSVLPALVDHGLFAYPSPAAFLDIGIPSAYAEAPAFFAACAHRRQRPRQGLLVVDRDGTLIEERHYLADPAGVQLLPGVVEGLRRFAASGYELAIVTNQSGIARGYFGEQELQAIHQELLRQLAAEGIAVRGIWHCPHHPQQGCQCRKPGPELLESALDHTGYRPEQCLVVGDKACDIELGRRLGVRTALVRTGYGLGTERDGLCSPDVVADNLLDLSLVEAGA